MKLAEVRWPRERDGKMVLPAFQRVGYGRWRTVYHSVFCCVYETANGKRAEEIWNWQIGRGFEFDGASIPLAVRVLLSPLLLIFGIDKLSLHPAAVAHDWLYRRQEGKDFADHVFFGLLVDANQEWFEGRAFRRRLLGARLAYWAVKFGGGGAYRANGEKKKWAVLRARYLASRMQRGGEGQEEFEKLEAIYSTGFWREAK